MKYLLIGRVDRIRVWIAEPEIGLTAGIRRIEVNAPRQGEGLNPKDALALAGVLREAAARAVSGDALETEDVNLTQRSMFRIADVPTVDIPGAYDVRAQRST
jgi:hypothetical protein